jgi:hypothetical protein
MLFFDSNSNCRNHRERKLNGLEATMLRMRAQVHRIVKEEERK